MFVYNPEHMRADRMKRAEEILGKLPVKYCFISGSFLFKKKYKDIDIFAITRSKRDLRFGNIKITKIDFNDLYSLFYHSVSKSCVSKSILPVRPVKVSMSDYWGVINDTVPSVMNRMRLQKSIRSLIVYTEYLKSGHTLDSYHLRKHIEKFKGKNKVLEYLKMNVPVIIRKMNKKSYIKRFFYTQSGFYEGFAEYDAQVFLKELAISVVHGT